MHVFYHLGCRDPDVHVLDGWIPAMETHSMHHTWVGMRLSVWWPSSYIHTNFTRSVTPWVPTRERRRRQRNTANQRTPDHGAPRLCCLVCSYYDSNLKIVPLKLISVYALLSLVNLWNVFPLTASGVNTDVFTWLLPLDLFRTYSQT